MAVCLITSACYSGGWACYFSLDERANMLAGIYFGREIVCSASPRVCVRFWYRPHLYLTVLAQVMATSHDRLQGMKLGLECRGYRPKGRRDI